MGRLAGGRRSHLADRKRVVAIEDAGAIPFHRHIVGREMAEQFAQAVGVEHFVEEVAVLPHQLVAQCFPARERLAMIGGRGGERLPDDIAIVENVAEQFFGMGDIHRRMAEQVPICLEPVNQRLAGRVGLIDADQELEDVTQRERLDDRHPGGRAIAAIAIAGAERRDDIAAKAAVPETGVAA